MSEAIEIDYDLLAEKIAEKQVELSQDRFLNKDEVCKRLAKISPQTLMRWVKADKFPKPEQEGANVFWRKSTVDNYFTNLKAN